MAVGRKNCMIIKACSSSNDTGEKETKDEVDRICSKYEKFKYERKYTEYINILAAVPQEKRAVRRVQVRRYQLIIKLDLK